jgi:2-polyprenyl-3-methyl-5-hydroxy-6-metoxy-1,4-benzoquinol methylase
LVPGTAAVEGFLGTALTVPDANDLPGLPVDHLVIRQFEAAVRGSNDFAIDVSDGLTVFDVVARIVIERLDQIVTLRFEVRSLLIVKTNLLRPRELLPPRLMDDRPRFDGLADWYDQEIRHLAGAHVTETALQSLIRLLGSGPGKCLDLGCGTGIAIPDLIRLGWSVVGVDISADQLRVAREQTRGLAVDLLEGDASHLPFAAGSFDAVVSMLTHTDFDDPPAVFAEIYAC